MRELKAILPMDRKNGDSPLHHSSRHLFVQSLQWKHQNNVWNLLKFFVILIVDCEQASTG